MNLRRHEQKSLINAGASLIEEDTEGIKVTLCQDAENIQLRFKLIGFYLKKMYASKSAAPELFNQMEWLMRNRPNMPLFNGVEGAYAGFDREQSFSMHKVLLDTLEREALCVYNR